MKRVKLNQDVGYWGLKGEIHDVSNERASWLLKKRVQRDGYDITIYSYAELMEDLGTHIGRSKQTYKKAGPSKVINQDGMTLARVMKALGMDQPKKRFLCKLCGCVSSPDDYAMTKKGKRWYHDICLRRQRRGLKPLTPPASVVHRGETTSQ